MDYSPRPRLALRAMTSSAVEGRYASVRSGILASQSRLRGNDDNGNVIETFPNAAERLRADTEREKPGNHM